MKKSILLLAINLFAFNAFASDWVRHQVNAAEEMGRAFESLSFVVNNIPESQLGNLKLLMALDNASGNIAFALNESVSKEERLEALDSAFESTQDAKKYFKINSKAEMALDNVAGSILTAKRSIQEN